MDIFAKLAFFLTGTTADPLGQPEPFSLKKAQVTAEQKSYRRRRERERERERERCRSKER